MLPISVVIPVYNRAVLLKRALRSVYAQTLAPAEIVVVDDGSTDGASEMVAREFPDVTLYRQESRKGVSQSRNFGIARCLRSDWIALLDSDDEWLPKKLERQAERIEAVDDARLVHCDEIWMRRGVRVNPKRKHQKRGGDIYLHCLPLCVISPSAAVMRRDLFREVGFFDPDLPVCEDYDMWLRATLRHPVEYVDEPLLIKHGGHDDQLSKAYPAMDRYRMQSLLKILQAGGGLADQTLRKATLETFVEKADIYIAGAKKRERLEEVEKWSAVKDELLNECNMI